MSPCKACAWGLVWENKEGIETWRHFWKKVGLYLDMDNIEIFFRLERRLPLGGRHEENFWIKRIFLEDTTTIDFYFFLGRNDSL